MTFGGVAFRNGPSLRRFCQVSNGPGADGANFVVVANRLPVDLERMEDGTERWRHSPGGLVTALEPFLRSRHGAWVGWPGVADADVPAFSDEGMLLHPVSLSSTEMRDYYEGFSNGTLWPLYHDVVVRPSFERSWWDSYVKVNQRFADACAGIAADGATVGCRTTSCNSCRRCCGTSGRTCGSGSFCTFRFRLSSSSCNCRGGPRSFAGCWGRTWPDSICRVGRRTSSGWLGGWSASNRRARRWGCERGRVWCSSAIEPFGLARSDLHRRDRAGHVVAAAGRGGAGQKIRADLGNPKKIMLGVDRLDYTKGIDVRLRALGELLEENRIDPADVVMVQLATPSRERVEHYRQMRGSIEGQVGRINGEFARVGHPVVHYLHQSVDREELVAFFSAADVMVVTPVRDGMNLVCKEYVASRHDLGGVLVLSEFAGAAAELTSALLVNPHDLDGVKTALLTALTMDPAEGRRRMRALRRQVLTHDVDRWARSFIAALNPVDQPEVLY